MQSSKRAYSQRILRCLINSDKEKYISYLNGREVMDWTAINTDAKNREDLLWGCSQGKQRPPRTNSKTQFTREVLVVDTGLK